MTLLTAEDYLRFPTVEPDWRYDYGSHPLQFGELTLPESPPPQPVIILIHGGGYREIYDLRPLGSVVASLAAAGFAVWNIEYRRFGNGGEYPAMFLDVGAAADHLRRIAEARGLDLGRVIAMGHSAGGHLALWLAGRRNIEDGSPLFVREPLPIHGAVGLAPLADVSHASEDDLSSDALLAVMGGAASDAPQNYRSGCPARLLPLAAEQVIIVGSEDKAMLANARHYVEAAAQTGGEAALQVIPAVGHFEIVAVEHGAWTDVLQAVRQLSERIQRQRVENG